MTNQFVIYSKEISDDIHLEPMNQLIRHMLVSIHYPLFVSPLIDHLNNEKDSHSLEDFVHIQINHVIKDQSMHCIRRPEERIKQRFASDRSIVSRTELPT